MKLSVNLYQPQLQPQPQHYRLSSLLRLAALMLVLVLIAQLVLQWQTTQLQRQLARQQQLVGAKTTELENLQQALANQQPDPSLQQSLQQLSQLNNQKQQLLQMLEHTANEPRPQFFLVMRDLAAADKSGFWLTQFRLGAHEIRFYGVTRDAAQLPGWLQQLGQNPYLRQRSFAQIKLEPASGAFLQFEVSSGSTP